MYNDKMVEDLFGAYLLRPPLFLINPITNSVDKITKVQVFVKKTDAGSVTVRLLVPFETSPYLMAILTATRMSIPHSLAILPLKVEDIPHFFAIYQPSNSHLQHNIFTPPNLRRNIVQSQGPGAQDRLFAFG